MGTYGRRRFLTLAGATGLTVTGSALLPATAFAQGPPTSGTDLTGWSSVVGDGGWVGPGETPIGPGDIAAAHAGSHSTLTANVAGRNVMTHHRAFTRIPGLPAAGGEHRVSTELRLPALPSIKSTSFNVQSVEISMYVWDGPGSRLEHGLCVQWVLNPWSDRLGELRARREANGVVDWVPISTRTPDIDWHRFELRFDPATSGAALEVDGAVIDGLDSFATAQPGWGSSVDGRMHVDVLSLWPGGKAGAPSADIEVRNWSWIAA